MAGKDQGYVWAPYIIAPSKTVLIDPIRQNGLKFEGIIYRGQYQGIKVYADPYIGNDRVIVDKGKNFMVVSSEVAAELSDRLKIQIDPIV